MGRPQSTPSSIQRTLVDALAEAFARGWTQTDVANALRDLGCPYSQRTISDWVRLKSPIPHRAAVGLSELLKIPMNSSQPDSGPQPVSGHNRPEMDPKLGRLVLELRLDSIVLAWLSEMTLPTHVDDATARAVVVTLHQAARTAQHLLSHAEAAESVPEPPRRPAPVQRPPTAAPPTPPVDTLHVPSRPDFTKPKR
jgi:hypothetical protein